MTDTAEFPYRLALGWITLAALEASDSYLLTNFPVQTDQISIFRYPWGPPDDFSTFPAAAAYGQNSDQTQWEDGAVSFTWDLAYLSEDMVYYLEGLLWGGVGLYPDAETQFVPVTAKTRKHHGRFAAYQCYANRPRPNQSYKRGNRGLENYRIDFVGGTRITA